MGESAYTAEEFAGLESRISDLETENDGLERQLREITEERDELKAKCDRWSELAERSRDTLDGVVRDLDREN